MSVCRHCGADHEFTGGKCRPRDGSRPPPTPHVEPKAQSTWRRPKAAPVPKPALDQKAIRAEKRRIRRQLRKQRAAALGQTPPRSDS